jgi:hypothetical protein
VEALADSEKGSSEEYTLSKTILSIQFGSAGTDMLTETVLYVQLPVQSLLSLVCRTRA